MSAAPTAAEPTAPAPAPVRLDLASWVALAVCAGLLLVNLGAYGVWDDEANTALFSRNVWRFGDTTAWDGTNLVAFREGVELTGTMARAWTPGQYFYAAPFLGLLGPTSSFAARLPFALAALAGFALWAWWLLRARAPWPVRLATLALVLGNVSLFLYSRQARYYSLGWSLTLAVAYLYLHRHDSRRSWVLLALASIGLLAVHYLSYGAAMVCLGLDFLVFEARLRRDRWQPIALFLGSQVVGVVVIVGVYSPFGRKLTGYVPVSWWADRLKLFWWNLRDLVACEFFFTPVLVLALAVWALGRFKDAWLHRMVLALLVYAGVASLLSQQPVGWASVSDIRYMSAVIPLGVALTVRTLTSAPRFPPALGAALAAALVAHTAPWAWFQRAVRAPTSIPERSTPVAFLGELEHPQRSAYREASDWLNANVPDGATVFVQPDYATYPLMFHAPTLRYMWQLRQDQRPRYPELGDHHFKHLGVPDVLVAFGPDVNGLRGLVAQAAVQGVQYDPEVRLDVVGPDRTRPELFWRSFVTTPLKDPATEGTYVFRRAGVRR